MIRRAMVAAIIAATIGCREDDPDDKPYHRMTTEAKCDRRERLLNSPHFSFEMKEAILESMRKDGCTGAPSR